MEEARWCSGKALATAPVAFFSDMSLQVDSETRGNNKWLKHSAGPITFLVCSVLVIAAVLGLFQGVVTLARDIIF